MLSLGNKINLKIGKNLSKRLTEELMVNFTYTVCDVKTEVIDEENVIYMENGERIELADNDYGYNVTENGAFFTGKDVFHTLLSFMAVIDKIEMKEDQSVYIDDKYCKRILKKAYIEFRSLHLCVSGATDMYMFEKSIRLAAFLGYSHIILEVTELNFDCMKELGWEGRQRTKEDIRKIVAVAKEFGIDVIPSYNVLGHAAKTGVLGGKHIVLDQNPKLAYLFSPSGWEWNIKVKEVYDITISIIDEMLEVFGDGEYYHIGVDETFTYEETEESLKEFADFINRVVKHIESKGRRVMMWGDMLLSHERYSGQPYFANGQKIEFEGVLADNLSKNIIIVDWQYRQLEKPWITSKYLKEKGFDVICCSWKHTFENVDSAMDTVIDEGLFGFMQSTWHPMYENIETYIRVIHGGLRSFDKDSVKNLSNDVSYTLKTVSPALRKLMPSPNVEKAGFPL